MSKKVFMCGFSQESNSFNPVLASLSTFNSFNPFWGDGAKPDTFCSPTANGMYEVYKDAGCEIYTGPVIRGGSGGPVDHSVVDKFLDVVLDKIKSLMPLDGVSVAMHGATVSDKEDDVCGYVLEAIRKVIGEDIPLTVAFDLHANVTEKIVKNADFVSGYQAYPHLDQKETGSRAAKRLLEAMDGKKYKLARVSVPHMASAHGYTTETGSLNKLVKRAKKLIENGEIVDYTIFEVQPWLDVKDISTTVIVIAETEEKAKSVATDLAFENFTIREELLGEKLLSVQEVINKAKENKSGKPVILADSADSPNAGATSDSAYVLEALLPYRDELECAVSVTDVPAVEKAISLGVGGKSDFTLGATLAPELSTPVLVKDAEVMGIYDGIFYLYGPQDKGGERNIGKTVVLKAGKIWINVPSEGRFEGDLNFYKTFGINPENCDLVDVKACTSFRAGYEPISAEICNTDTKGAAGGVLTELPFRNLPVPMYPFEEISQNDISEAKCYR
ncbi:MAG: M81 family metallopeptidase [Clostridia bacterium]|nr:M81 family metallopeptidase [Clostridia bacterium]